VEMDLRHKFACILRLRVFYGALLRSQSGDTGEFRVITAAE
jgi:hypothetical protein